MNEGIDALALWRWLPIGYLLTVAIEMPVLVAGLGRGAWRDDRPVRRYTRRERLAAALWLTAATYPTVTIILPLLLWPRVSYASYFLVAEAFAIAVECLLFRWVWRGSARDLVVVALANVASAAVGALAACSL